jgi:hypothetical protein
VLDALRAFNIRPGDYVAPHPHGSSPDFAELSKRGPVVMMTVLPGDVVIAKNLVLWFQFAGATAFIGFALGLWQQTIWYSRSWVTTLKSTIDGLIYGAVIAGVFAWLWPR